MEYEKPASTCHSSWQDFSIIHETKPYPPHPITDTLQISLVMDKFESQFTDLDVQTSYMEGAMSDTTAVATPQDQVDNLINQVADEAGLEREHALQLPPTAAPAVAAPAAVEKDKVGEEDGRLADRLRALRVSAYLRNGELGNEWEVSLCIGTEERNCARSSWGSG